MIRTFHPSPRMSKTLLTCLRCKVLSSWQPCLAGAQSGSVRRPTPRTRIGQSFSRWGNGSTCITGRLPVPDAHCKAQSLSSCSTSVQECTIEALRARSLRASTGLAVVGRTSTCQGALAGGGSRRGRSPLRWTPDGASRQRQSARRILQHWGPRSNRCGPPSHPRFTPLQPWHLSWPSLWRRAGSGQWAAGRRHGLAYRSIAP